MACMQHICRKCNDMWMDNNITGYCKCGSNDVLHLFEEDIQAVELEMEGEDE